MTIEELRDLMRRLHLDEESEPQMIYLFYRTPDGRINNFSISIRSARQRNRRPMTDQQLVDLMQQYPDAKGARLLAIEHPKEGLTQWLDTQDVCRRLHTTRKTLHRWCSLGLLHPSKLGGRLYYDPADVEHLLRSNVVQDNGRIDKAGMAPNEV